MKADILFLSALALTLSFSACQNNDSKSETDHFSMDSNDMDMIHNL